MHRRPLRIAFVTRSMHVGGVETHMLRLGRFLQAHGCKVEIFTTVLAGPWFSKIAEWRLGGSSLAPFRLPRKLFRYFRLHSAYVGLRLALGGYDVVFLNHESYAQHSLCLLPGGTVAIPIIHSHHPQIYEVAAENAEIWNVAVAVGKQGYDTFRARVASRPVVHIPNGVEIPDAGRLARRRPHSLPFRLSFLGRLELAKGVMLLPEILRECVVARGLNVVLSVAGDGPQRHSLERRLNECGLAGRVDFRGQVSPDEAYALLLDSHVNLLPSFQEGFPLVLLEAQACGCVPVATRMPGITDVSISEGKTGFLVDQSDVPGFAGAVSELYRSPPRWDEMSGKGRERIARAFSIEVMGEAYLRVIRQAVAGGYPLARSRWKSFPLSLFRRVLVP